MKSEIYDYIVEWDDAKNEINISKHGISFETAAYIFNDVNRIASLSDNNEETAIFFGTIHGALHVGRG